MTALGEEILTTDIIDIEVISKADNSTIRVYRGCTAVDYSENFRVGAISGENATFQYLSCDTGEKKEVAKEDGGGGGPHFMTGWRRPPPPAPSPGSPSAGPPDW